MRARPRLVRLGAALMTGTLMLAGAAETREPAGRSNANESLATIVDVWPGTAMPTWRPFLTEVEAYWLIFRLKQGDAHVLR